LDNGNLCQITDYAAKIMQAISSDKTCVSLLLNKAANNITEDDEDKVLEERVFDYQYVDETTTTTSAYIWVETEVRKVQNKHIKDMDVFVTVACHKDFMKLNPSIYRGYAGNRKDNLIIAIDKLLNGSGDFGIGELSLRSCESIGGVNGYTAKQLRYEVPDFNRR